MHATCSVNGTTWVALYSVCRAMLSSSYPPKLICRYIITPIPAGFSWSDIIINLVLLRMITAYRVFNAIGIALICVYLANSHNLCLDCMCKVGFPYSSTYPYVCISLLSARPSCSADIWQGGPLPSPPSPCPDSTPYFDVAGR